MAHVFARSPAQDFYDETPDGGELVRTWSGDDLPVLSLVAAGKRARTQQHGGLERRALSCSLTLHLLQEMVRQMPFFCISSVGNDGPERRAFLFMEVLAWRK